MPWMRLERDQEARDRASSHLLVGHRASTDMLTPMAKTWGPAGTTMGDDHQQNV
jgi:hypothetical protein